MKRIYHTWEKWECYPAGFYNSRPEQDLIDAQCESAYRDLLCDLPAFREALERVITEWRHSCEHYLTNENMNRIAWLGQASLCIARGIPSCFRGGFNLLSASEQQAANGCRHRIARGVKYCYRHSGTGAQKSKKKSA